DTKIRPRTGRQWSGQSRVNGECTLPSSGINPRNLTLDNTVAGIDFDRLSQLHIFDLRFGNLQFGLKRSRISHARDVEARGYLLAHLNRNLLQHTFRAGADFEVVNLLVL